MTFIGKTIQGLEEAAISETDGKLNSPGRVEFETLKESYRTLESVYELLTSFKFKTLKDIIEQVKKLKLSINGTYKCKCSFESHNQLTSMEVEQTCGKAIGENNPLDYSPKEYDHAIIIDIVENNCNIGISKNKTIPERIYRFNLHNQTTPATLAASIIKYLNIKKDETLLCIESKDGIIPIEAAFQNINVSANDLHSNNIRNARINTQLAKKEIQFNSKEILNLEKSDYMLTQIVFSKKKKGPYKLIHDIFKLAETKLNNKLVILTNHPKDIESYKPKTIKLLEQKEIKHKKLDLTLLIYSKE
ncbi:hypothetical protein HN992_02225 [Candidatus Woesearchaeota archaeon]|jgi:hypothetical protein|nr:hypothetical protein [Candidatus Woesearchaeota archaeon]MBT3439033.1 hypothetical protein [Candidatus Woesearchaeota archaeon]MBT4058544.1 hypothetical protein [Candidatus Woesearchaeota archaeon]MBT4207102.1 hypothetical protein [Candidatus Woesearchaeota archaeon]MBT4732652.1 hypothetical protein [Candidatus Woesearchaeota archaeon]